MSQLDNGKWTDDSEMELKELCNDFTNSLANPFKDA